MNLKKYVICFYGINITERVYKTIMLFKEVTNLNFSIFQVKLKNLLKFYIN
jgi:hypothetical protein